TASGTRNLLMAFNGSLMAGRDVSERGGWRTVTGPEEMIDDRLHAHGPASAALWLLPGAERRPTASGDREPGRAARPRLCRDPGSPVSASLPRHVDVAVFHRGPHHEAADLHRRRQSPVAPAVDPGKGGRHRRSALEWPFRSGP